MALTYSSIKDILILKSLMTVSGKNNTPFVANENITKQILHYVVCKVQLEGVWFTVYHFHISISLKENMLRNH